MNPDCSEFIRYERSSNQRSQKGRVDTDRKITINTKIITINTKKVALRQQEFPPKPKLGAISGILTISFHIILIFPHSQKISIPSQLTSNRNKSCTKSYVITYAGSFSRNSITLKKFYNLQT